MDDFSIFSDCWSRIKKSTDISTLTDLADILDVSQPTVSRKKAEDIFPKNWAIIVGYKSNIHPEWIMTGNESFKSRETTPSFKNDILEDIEKWLSEQIKKEPFREGWFEGTFLDAFPLFAEWKKSQKDQERNNSSVQNKAA